MFDRLRDDAFQLDFAARLDVDLLITEYSNFWNCKKKIGNKHTCIYVTMDSKNIDTNLTYDGQVEEMHLLRIGGDLTFVRPRVPRLHVSGTRRKHSNIFH